MQADTTLARWRFRTGLWLEARTLPWRIAGKDLRAMLRLYSAPGEGDLPAFEVPYIERCIRWAVRTPLLMRNRRCLRSGLLGYKTLRRAGYAPILHFSVARNAARAARIDAHCWVTIDGQPVVNLPMRDHVLLFSYPHAMSGDSLP